MVRVVNLCTLTALLVVLAPQALADQSNTRLLDKYLRDPFRTIGEEDSKFEGDLAAPAGPELEKVFLGGVTLKDWDGDNRADLVIPVTRSDKVTGRLVFLNRSSLPHFSNSDKAMHFVRGAAPTNAQLRGPVNVDGDINGDGLIDSFDLDFGSDPIDGRNRFSISNVQLNFGIAIVSESQVSGRILDARLGYLATYAIAFGSTARSAPNLAIADAKQSWVDRSRKGRIAMRLAEPVLTEAARHRTIRPTECPPHAMCPPDGDDFPWPTTPPKTIPSSPPPPPSPVTPQSVIESLKRHHHEIAFDLISDATGALYVPDMAFYQAGIERGSLFGRSDAELLRRTNGLTSESGQVVGALNVELEKVVKQSGRPDSVTSNALSSAVARVSAFAQGHQQPEFDEKLHAVADILASLPMSPRVLDLRLNPVALGRPEPRPELLTQANLDALDGAAFLPKGDAQIVVNAGRIVGSALAFLSLNVMRADRDYARRIAEKEGGASYLELAREQVQAIEGSRAKHFLKIHPTMNDLAGSDLVQATLASGYTDLARLVFYDAHDAAYWAGYEKGKADALEYLKQFLGDQIPQLSKAKSIEEAAVALRNAFIAQQKEIERLKAVINQLEQTIADLRESLQKARETIANLNSLIDGLKETNEELRRTVAKAGDAMQKLGHTADAATRFLNAGSGFLMGGPIGAIICFFRCK